jgi:hypothetical protein
MLLARRAKGHADMNINHGNQQDDEMVCGLAFVLLYRSVKGNARRPVSPMRNTEQLDNE